MNLIKSATKTRIQSQKQMQTSFYPVNSTALIRQFHQFNKQNQRKKMMHKKQLQKEIKKTNYNIKIKKLRKNIKLQKVLQNQNHFNCKYAQSTIDQKNQEGEFSSTFNQFIFRKKIKNTNLKLKMKLFGNSITDRRKAGIQKQINNQLTKIEQRKTVNNAEQYHYLYDNQKILDQQQDKSLQKPQSDVQFAKKQINKQQQKQKIQRIKRFTICHMVLDKLLGLMVQNPHLITLKYQNSQIYKNLKKQMLQILINNQKIRQSLRNLQNQMRATAPSKFNFSKLKFKKIQKQRGPYYLLQQQKKDELSEQISNIIQSLKQMIDQALFNFNKPDVAYNLQQHWQHRQGNILSTENQDKDWNKTQSLLRSTTIKRLKCI